MYSVSIQEQDFDLAAEMSVLHSSSANIGAMASFIGFVREQEPKASAPQDTPLASLLALEIEHYPAMTQSSIERLCEQAQERWALLNCRVIHRTGRINVGEQIVLVLVCSLHRQAAFEACEFIMDYLKTSAPFWKKALFHDSEQWVDAKQSDKKALDKWQD